MAGNLGIIPDNDSLNGGLDMRFRYIEDGNTSFWFDNATQTIVKPSYSQMVYIEIKRNSTGLIKRLGYFYYDSLVQEQYYIIRLTGTWDNPQWTQRAGRSSPSCPPCGTDG